LSWPKEPEKEGIMPKQNYLCIQRSQPGKGEKPEFTEPAIVLNPEDDGVDPSIHPEKETADGLIPVIRQSSATDVIEVSEGKPVSWSEVRLEGQPSPLGVPLLKLSRHARAARSDHQCAGLLHLLYLFLVAGGLRPGHAHDLAGPRAPRWAMSVQAWCRWGRPIIAPTCSRGATP
jgi:hypothetical protein